MPFRNYDLDLGYTAPPIAPQKQKRPEADWGAGQWADALTIATLPVNPTAMQTIARHSGTFHSAFRLENDVVNTVDLLTRSHFPADPNFKVVERLKETGLWDDYRDNFLGVESEAEFQDVLGRIQEEQQDKATLMNAGPVGLLAVVAAGSASPTVLLPFVGPARGLVGVAKGVGWGLIGGLAQEFPLQLAQETRTLEESAFSVGASAVLGGVLGGAVGYVNKARYDEMIAEMDGGLSRGETQPSDLGAASARQSAGRVKGALGAEQVIGSRGPVGRLLGSPVVQALQQKASRQGAWMMAQLDTAGTTLEGNVHGIASAQGGTASARIQQYYGMVAQVVKMYDDAFSRYWFGNPQPGAFANLRSSFYAMLPGRTRMSKAEFKREVSIALRNNDQHEIPEVAEVAAFTRKTLLDPILERAEEQGLFKVLRDEEGFATVKGDRSYLLRDYNTEAIGRRRQEFVNILASHFEQKLNDDFLKRLEKFLTKQERDTELTAAMKLPREEIEAARKAYQEELKAIDESLSEEDAALEDFLRDARSATFDKSLDDNAKQALREAIRDLEAKGGPELVARRAERRRIRRQISNLNKAVEMVADKQNAKLSRVNRLEELQTNSIVRTVRRGQRFLRQLAGMSDARLDKELSGLKNEFQRVGDQFDAAEARIGRLISEPVEARGAFGAFMDPKEAQPVFAQFKTVGQALNHIEKTSKSLRNRVLARELAKQTADTPFRVMSSEELLEAELGSSVKQSTRTDTHGFWYDNRTPTGEIIIRGDSNIHGLNEDVILHEAVHGATVRQIEKGLNDLIRGDVSTVEASAVRRLGELRRYVERLYQANRLPGQQDVYTKYGLSNVHEFVAVALTDTDFQNILKQMESPYSPNKTMWSTLVESLKTLLGLKRVENSILEQVLSEAAVLMRQPKTSPWGTVASAASALSPTAVARQGRRFSRLTELAEQIGRAENADRDAIRSVVEEELRALAEQTAQLNARRATRAERLRQQAGALDPEQARARIAELEEGVRAREREFRENIRERGAEGDIDLAAGRANFRQYALDAADLVTQKIMGTNVRLPGVDIMQGKRGAELQRMLDIDSNLLRTQDGVSFIEEDFEKLVMKYARTLGPDIEITRAFGELDPENMRNVEFTKLNDEYRQKDEALDAELERRLKKPPTQAQKDKAHKELLDEYTQLRRNLEGVIGRLRHTWGMPKDPDGFAARAARSIMNLNVLRFMGGVTISSVPDIGRPIMKYGLMRTFRDGWVPLVSNIKGFKATRRELELAGAALDLTLHTRAHQVYDIGDYMVRGSKFEKSLEWATSKMGLIAVFDFWTTAMKQVAGATAISEILDDVTSVVAGKAVPKQIERLAAKGIDGNVAQQIATELSKTGGGERIDGIWWPNTEAWTNREARDAFRAALSAHVDSTIITPGVERPLWTDSNVGFRMMTQFKSFAFASTTKTFMAGLQQRDMAVVTGTMISLALGALSYYIYASLAGGKIQQEMLSAGPDRWADEAISRSGVLASAQLMQDVLARIPSIAPYVTFSGQRTSRRGGEGAFEALAGPSADMMVEAFGVLGDLDEPTRGTVDRFLNLVPLQNHFMLRRAFDQIAAASGLPERRS